MQKFLLITCVCLLGVFVYWNSIAKHPVSVSDNLFLKNVEALADEEYQYPIFCDGDGDFTCPKIERKVRYVFQGLSLHSDEESY